MSSNPDPRNLLQLISEGFIFVDRHFRVLEMNAEAERIEGHPAEHIIGLSLWERWPDLEESEFGNLWRKALAERSPVSLSQAYTWPDGRTAWVEMRAFPSDEGLAIFYRDTSLSKKTEDELQRTQNELIHASRLSAMGAMAATLAHEISQPLTAISNYLEASRKELDALKIDRTERAQEALKYAGAATGRAREILKRLRDFVARRPFETDLHDIHMIIADAMLLIQPYSDREGTRIEFRLHPEPLLVQVDAIQIQQVLINLVRNAIEAMTEQRRRRRRVTITTARMDNKVHVEIEDDGPGLGNAQDLVFKPFHSRKADGLGIGLSISRFIIEAHDGHIEGMSSPGRGALFRFELPSADLPEANPDPD